MCTDLKSISTPLLCHFDYKSVDWVHSSSSPTQSWSSSSFGRPIRFACEAVTKALNCGGGPSCSWDTHSNMTMMTKCQIGNWNNVQESAFHITPVLVSVAFRPPFIHEDNQKPKTCTRPYWAALQYSRNYYYFIIIRKREFSSGTQLNLLIFHTVISVILFMIISTTITTLLMRMIIICGGWHNACVTWKSNQHLRHYRLGITQFPTVRDVISIMSLSAWVEC